MFRFTENSKKKLNTCHPELKRLFYEVVKHYDCTVIEGHRSEKRQAELYRTGYSQVDAGKSKHNSLPSKAIDVAPCPVDWKDEASFYHFVGYVTGIARMMGINIRTGADWNGNNNLHDQSFFDLAHFELLEEKD